MTRSFDVAVRSLLSRAEVLSGRRERDQDIHRTVQARLRRKYATFRAEAVLSVRVQAGDSEVRVTGRVDGYRRSRRGLLLYEIKSVPSHPHRWLGHPLLEPAREQLRLYADLSDQATTRLWGDGPIVAAILLLSDGRRTVMEEVSLSSPPGLVARRATHWMAVSSRTPFQSASELERFVEGDRQADRAEQREACERLQRSLERVGRVLLTMPPGTGKTRVALRAGLLRAKQCGCRLYWITTKSRGRDEVLAEVQRYLDAGIPLRVLWKTSAERTCQCGREAASCPVKLDTHRDLFSAGLPRLVHGPRWSFSDLAAHAQSSSLCLHELSAQAEELADVVIADANYLLERSTVDRKAVFVADEAQNLVERCRALVETCLTTSDLRSVMSKRLSEFAMHGTSWQWRHRSAQIRHRSSRRSSGARLSGMSFPSPFCSGGYGKTGLRN
jgi:hypothetical protein